MRKKPILQEERFRSTLEERIADQLEQEGIPFDYESEWVPYTVPERQAKYLPDFVINGTNIILEGKGRFHTHQAMCPKCRSMMQVGDGAQERQKLILLKEQHPERDIRIVFQRASTPIYKGSKTTYAKWAEDHGFTYSDKGAIPPAWMVDLKKGKK